jgi:uncharacterized membrane protein YfcA
MDKKRALSAKTVARLSAGGLSAGVVNGIFGNGGGVVVVFLFSSMAPLLFSDRREIFSNVTAAVLPIALTSALIYSSVSPPSASDAVAVGAASLAGGIVGAILLGKIDPRALKILFAVLMVISGILMIV